MPLYNTQSSFRILAKSSGAVTLTGTTAMTTLGSFVVPAGSMGSSGVLRLTALYSLNVDASTKYIDILFGAGTALNTLDAANYGALVQVAHIANIGSPAQQVGSTYQTAGGIGVGPALISGTENTAANVTVAFRAQLGDAADNIVLKSWFAELCPGI